MKIFFLRAILALLVSTTLLVSCTNTAHDEDEQLENTEYSIERGEITDDDI